MGGPAIHVDVEGTLADELKQAWLTPQSSCWTDGDIIIATMSVSVPRGSLSGGYTYNMTEDTSRLSRPRMQGCCDILPVS